MNPERETERREDGTYDNEILHENHASTGGAAATGALTGGMIGALAAGPAGAVVGAIGGAIAGAVGERAMHAGTDTDAEVREEYGIADATVRVDEFGRPLITDDFGNREGLLDEPVRSRPSDYTDPSLGVRPGEVENVYVDPAPTPDPMSPRPPKL